jgi:predicted MFS family arabinose efflux permease
VRLPAIATDGRVVSPLALTLAVRLPSVSIGVLLLLQARALGFSYAIGGLATGAFAVGMAIGAPSAARIADRHGQSPVVHAGAVAAGLTLVAVTRVPAGQPALLLALAAVGGLTLPPVAPCLRSIWSQTLAGRRRDMAYALEASLQELAFMFGPMLFVLLATQADPATALVLAGLAITLFGSLFALLPDARATRQQARARAESGRSRVGVLGSSGMRTLIALTAALGMMFGTTEVAILAATEAWHTQRAAGLLFVAWGSASLPAGLLWAHRAHGRDRIRSIQCLLLALGLASALLSTAPSTPWLALVLVVTGVSVAPLLGLLYGLVQAVAPTDAMTQAYAWLATGMMVGSALGAATAGLIRDQIGLHTVWLFGSGAVLAGLLQLTVRATALREQADAPDGTRLV